MKTGTERLKNKNKSMSEWRVEMVSDSEREGDVLLHGEQNKHKLFKSSC